MSISSPALLTQRYVGVVLLSWVASSSSHALATRVTDYQHYLNPQFSREVRQQTRFIIIHSTESSLPSALRTLSRGKVRNGHYVSRGGHAHYLVARNGTIYRIVDPKYRANHAGLSMWNGFEDLSDYSIGIELEGYHNVPFRDEQYRSLKGLLDLLKRRYDIEDRNVLEHYRVAYSAPNHFHKELLRGRKLDPGVGNFNRLKAGLRDEPSEDPDVIAGRIGGVVSVMPASARLDSADEETEEEEMVPAAPSSNVISAAPSSNVISAAQTAWKIAGDQYKVSSTVYYFPGGTSLRGDQIHDWSNIPPGTEVRVGGVETRDRKMISPLRPEVVFPETAASLSPRNIANALYNSSFTFYIYPDGSLHPGNTISDWSKVPFRSKVLVAYRQMSPPQTRNRLGEDLEDVYLAAQTIYFFPDHSTKSGNQIEDFTRIPLGTRVLAKME
jgi:N-acetylmuramoyl-L-alanine amidase